MTDYSMTADTDRIREAGRAVSDHIAHALAEQADAVLDRPAFNTDGWLAERRALRAGEEWALARLREWHLTKIAIAIEAGLDPTGDAINARRAGATWQAIATHARITRQSAYERWARPAAAVIDNDEEHDDELADEEVVQ